tara:strand:- start:6890 stop:7606 length:717 start_codon:yes stop_codon:yes gene_type:complete
MKKHNVTAIIPARGGSKGLKHKNIAPLLGKPLIYYTVKAALSAENVDRVIVSTDSKLIQQAAIEVGAEAPFLRPNHLANDTATPESTLKHAVEWLEENENYKTDIVVYLQCTDIFRKRFMIDHLVEKLKEDDSLDSAFVAHPTHKKFWRRDNDGYQRMSSKTYTPRQKGNLYLREDAGIACATRTEVVKQEYRIGENIYILENEDEYSMIDIHDERTLYLAEKALEREKKINNLDYYY